MISFSLCLSFVCCESVRESAKKSPVFVYEFTMQFLAFLSRFTKVFPLEQYWQLFEATSPQFLHRFHRKRLKTIEQQNYTQKNAFFSRGIHSTNVSSENDYFQTVLIGKIKEQFLFPNENNKKKKKYSSIFVARIRSPWNVRIWEINVSFKTSKWYTRRVLFPSHRHAQSISLKTPPWAVPFSRGSRTAII